MEEERTPRKAHIRVRVEKARAVWVIITIFQTNYLIFLFFKYVKIQCNIFKYLKIITELEFY